MGGGSIGPQIGGQKTDYVLVIMNDKGLSNLLQDKFELGGEGSIRPVRSDARPRPRQMRRWTLRYLHIHAAKGFLPACQLKGVVISQDEDMNHAVYEKSAAQILGNPPVLASEAPAQLRKFSQTVAGLRPLSWLIMEYQRHASCGVFYIFVRPQVIILSNAKPDRSFRTNARQ